MISSHFSAFSLRIHNVDIKYRKQALLHIGTFWSSQQWFFKTAEKQTNKKTPQTTKKKQSQNKNQKTLQW